jgi:hypothetical protein
MEFQNTGLFPKSREELQGICSCLEQYVTQLKCDQKILTQAVDSICETDRGFMGTYTNNRWVYDLQTLSKNVSIEIQQCWLTGTMMFGVAADKLNHLWDTVPEEFKEVTEEILGDEWDFILDSTDFLVDTFSGELSWDTLDSFMKSVSEDNAEGSLIAYLFQLVVQPGGNMKTLMDGYDDNLKSASSAFAEGDIVQGLLDCGKAIGCGLGGIGYGVADGFTELAGEVAEDFLKLTTLPLRMGRHFIPGESGEIIDYIGDKTKEGIDGIRDFFRDLL